MNKIALAILIAVWGFRTVWASDVQSVYSDLTEKACKVTFEDPETHATIEDCPGVLGYSLLKETDDDREELAIVNGNEKQPLHFYGHVTGSFNHLGGEVEWRVRDGQPVALVIRMYFADLETGKKQQRLIVARVQPNGSCVTQIINASKIPNANDLATQAADFATHEKCLW